MFYIHPTIQITALVLAAYALGTGFGRGASLHLGWRTRFPWKRHVFVGRLALVGLLVGVGVGLTAVHLAWGHTLMTLGHGRTGVLLLPLIGFGLASGRILGKRKNKGPWLPLAHGINNAVLFGFGLHQIRTGIGVVRTFLSGL